jgi:hypothetical protein
MRSGVTVFWLGLAVVAFSLIEASCSEPKRPVAVAKLAPREASQASDEAEVFGLVIATSGSDYTLIDHTMSTDEQNSVLGLAKLTVTGRPEASVRVEKLFPELQRVNQTQQEALTALGGALKTPRVRGRNLGTLSLSRIAFDESHTVALIYAFRFKNGLDFDGTLFLLEKREGQWFLAERVLMFFG